MTYDELPSEIKSIYRTARKSAATRGIDFNLTGDDFASLWERAGMKCAVSGLKFFMNYTTSHNKRRPYFPSLDRKNSSLGYSVENCRFVCIAVNYAMNDWGEDVFRTIAEATVGIRTERARKMPKGVKVLTHKTLKGETTVSYQARVRVNGRQVSRSFDTPEEAASAYKLMKSALKRPLEI
jgi:hypothetical protein